MMRDMWKRDVNNILMSPLAVNTDDMLVTTMPPLVFRYFDVLPEKIKLQNNGLTGKVRIAKLYQDSTVKTFWFTAKCD